MEPNRIKYVRKQLGWSQQQLADYMGASRSIVSLWEIGRRKPNDLQTSILSELKSRVDNMSSERKKKELANTLANWALGGGLIALIVYLFKNEFEMD